MITNCKQCGELTYFNNPFSLCFKEKFVAERIYSDTEQCHSWCEKPNRLPFSDLNIPFKKEQKCLKCPICEKPYIVDLPATTLKLSACDKCIELAMKIENLDEEQRNAQLDTD